MLVGLGLRLVLFRVAWTRFISFRPYIQPLAKAGRDMSVIFILFSLSFFVMGACKEIDRLFILYV